MELTTLPTYFPQFDQQQFKIDFVKAFSQAAQYDISSQINYLSTVNYFITKPEGHLLRDYQTIIENLFEKSFSFLCGHGSTSESGKLLNKKKKKGSILPQDSVPFFLINVLRTIRQNPLAPIPAKFTLSLLETLSNITFLIDSIARSESITHYLWFHMAAKQSDPSQVPAKSGSGRANVSTQQQQLIVHNVQTNFSTLASEISDVMVPIVFEMIKNQSNEKFFSQTLLKESKDTKNMLQFINKIKMHTEYLKALMSKLNEFASNFAHNIQTATVQTMTKECLEILFSTSKWNKLVFSLVDTMKGKEKPQDSLKLSILMQELKENGAMFDEITLRSIFATSFMPNNQNSTLEIHPIEAILRNILHFNNSCAELIVNLLRQSKTSQDHYIFVKNLFCSLYFVTKQLATMQKGASAEPNEGKFQNIQEFDLWINQMKENNLQKPENVPEKTEKTATEEEKEKKITFIGQMRRELILFMGDNEFCRNKENYFPKDKKIGKPTKKDNAMEEEKDEEAQALPENKKFLNNTISFGELSLIITSLSQLIKLSLSKPFPFLVFMNIRTSAQVIQNLLLFNHNAQVEMPAQEVNCLFTRKIYHQIIPFLVANGLEILKELITLSKTNIIPFFNGFSITISRILENYSSQFLILVKEHSTPKSLFNSLIANNVIPITIQPWICLKILKTSLTEVNSAWKFLINSSFYTSELSDVSNSVSFTLLQQFFKNFLIFSSISGSSAGPLGSYFDSQWFSSLFSTKTSFFMKNNLMNKEFSFSTLVMFWLEATGLGIEYLVSSFGNCNTWIHKSGETRLSHLQFISHLIVFIVMTIDSILNWFSFCSKFGSHFFSSISNFNTIFSSSEVVSSNRKNESSDGDSEFREGYSSKKGDKKNKEANFAVDMDIKNASRLLFVSISSLQSRSSLNLSQIIENLLDLLCSLQLSISAVHASSPFLVQIKDLLQNLVAKIFANGAATSTQFAAWRVGLGMNGFAVLGGEALARKANTFLSIIDAFLNPRALPMYILPFETSKFYYDNIIYKPILLAQREEKEAKVREREMEMELEEKEKKATISAKNEEITQKDDLQIFSFSKSEKFSPKKEMVDPFADLKITPKVEKQQPTSTEVKASPAKVEKNEAEVSILEVIDSESEESETKHQTGSQKLPEDDDEELDDVEMSSDQQQVQKLGDDEMEDLEQMFK